MLVKTIYFIKKPKTPCAICFAEPAKITNFNTCFR